jgi:hypothetical protein
MFCIELSLTMYPHVLLVLLIAALPVELVSGEVEKPTAAYISDTTNPRML